MKYFLLALLMMSLGCSSKPTAVNSEIDYLPVLEDSAVATSALAAGASSNVQVRGRRDYLKRNPSVAISGQLLLKSEIPTPLSNTRVNLYLWANNAWKVISEMSTDIEGKFVVTQKLLPGKYQLNVMNPKYVGVLPVTLDDKPIKDLIFEVSRKN